MLKNDDCGVGDGGVEDGRDLADADADMDACPQD